jgi:hypothetical protein
MYQLLVGSVVIGEGVPQFDPRNCNREGAETTWCQNW